MNTKNLESVELNYSAALELFEPGFTKFYSGLEPKLNELKQTLKNANTEGETQCEYFKWLDFDYLRKTNELTKKLASELRSKSYLNLVLMGMGGSGINAMVLKNALYEFSPQADKKSKINLIIQNNLDSSSMLAKLESISHELDKTLFVLVSKSGGTDEVRRSFNIAIDFWRNQPGFSWEKLARQLVIITEPPRAGKSNFLHDLALELENKTGIKLAYLENDPNIGGRFSMFSPVGMFPAEMMGLDSNALIASAEAVFNKFLNCDNQQNDIAKLSAFDIYLSRQDYQHRYSMVYSDSLEAYNKFRAQLKGESLNKTGILSTVHIPGIGTVNHHSDLELLLKKNNGLVMEQVFFTNPCADHSNEEGLDCLKDLQASSNHQALLNNHINPLAQYIMQNGAPVIQRILPGQDENALGQALMMDMLGTVVQAGLQDAMGAKDKLDLSIRQWEVERYKKSLK